MPEQLSASTDGINRITVMDYQRLSGETVLVTISVEIRQEVWRILNADTSIMLSFSTARTNCNDATFRRGQSRRVLQRRVPLKINENDTLTVRAHLGKKDSIMASKMAEIALPPVPFLHQQAMKAFEIEEGVVIQPEEFMRVVRGSYVVKGPMTVSEGGILYLDPGVRMFFENEGGLYCEGQLIIQGGATEDQKVKLGGKNWSGVMLNGPYVAGSTLQHCEISGGRGDLGSLYNDAGVFSGFLKPYREGHGLPRYGGNLLIANTAGARVTLDGVILNGGTADFGGGIGLFHSTLGIGEHGLVLDTNAAHQSGGGAWLMASRMNGPGTITLKSNRAGVVGGGMTLAYGADCKARATFYENIVEKRGPNAYVFCREVPARLDWVPGVHAFPFKTS